METKYTIIVSKVKPEKRRNHNRKETDYEISSRASSGIAPKDSQLIWRQGAAECGNPRRRFLGRTNNVHAYPWLCHCDIRLAKNDQKRVLTEGKAHPHRWAPEAGFVTLIVNDEKDLEPAMDVIRMSHRYFADNQSVPRMEHE